MPGGSGLGTYMAYAAIWLFLLLVAVLFLRTAFLLSLLFLDPAASVLRRVPGVRRLIPRPPPPGTPEAARGAELEHRDR